MPVLAVDSQIIMGELGRKVGPKYEWDTPPELYIYTRQEGGEGIALATGGTFVVEPELIPKAVAAIVADTVTCGINPYLLVLKVEAYGVVDRSEDRGPDYAEQLARDQVGRNFKNRADSMEAVLVWAIDRNFRLWVVEKARGSSAVSAHYYPTEGLGVAGGACATALFAIVEALNNTPGIFWVREEF